MSQRVRDAGVGHVRIIGGQWRGTRLPVARIPGLRPTSDRVRETLFNWLQPVLPGARVMDVFAGSGALGLEAVSRGAREALLVEQDPTVARGLHDSVERLKAGGEAKVIRADALAWLRTPLFGRFDVIFVDPPFETNCWPTLLALLPAWSAEGGWLYVESPVASPACVDAAWAMHRQGQTRDVHYALYRRAQGAAATLGTGSRAHGTATE